MLVSPAVGPAVVGALAPRVVIPQWALSLDAPARALMLRHEREHIRARDPLLLLGGALATTFAPWNAALWLIVRRLRLAIEIDCDQRVLRASAQRREYGELLLTVGARQSAPLPFATSLAERRPFLERRIRAMTTTSPRYPRLVSAAHRPRGGCEHRRRARPASEFARHAVSPGGRSNSVPSDHADADRGAARGRHPVAPTKIITRGSEARPNRAAGSPRRSARHSAPELEVPRVRRGPDHSQSNRFAR